MKESLMKRRDIFVSSFLLLVTMSVVFSGAAKVYALTETTTGRTAEMIRLRVSSNDVKSASNVSDPGGVCGSLAKRVVLYTVPAAGQINSIVTKVRTAFAAQGLSQIGVIAVRAEQGGVQISNGDIAVPHTDMKDTVYLENRIPTSGEYAFYDENASWQVVAYVCGRNAQGDPMDVSSVTTGSMDFYTMVTRN
jgi:hypothetical protein